MTMAIRIKEIAEKANVSTATVSLVLNNKSGVGDATRSRILQIIDEMGYKTNILSKPALRDKGVIRLIIYKKHGYVVADTPFFSVLIEAIETESKKDGYQLMITYLNNNEHELTEMIQLLKTDLNSGIILLATEMNNNDVALFKKLNMPLVVLDSYFSGLRISTVIINNVEGAYEAVNHLLMNGHKQIGYLKSAVGINNFIEREEGFNKAMSDRGLVINPSQIFSLESTMEGAYRDMSLILKNEPIASTAFFADNDLIALGAMKALKENGYKIPEQISIIGFDDLMYCRMSDPPLSTVRVYNDSMGKSAIQLLKQQLELKSSEWIKIQVGTRLMERESVSKLQEME
jgi:DNA-binding LacI/PurR family transcriptional regulator